MNKAQFFESINYSISFNEDFFKKVYGYSVCDDLFLHAVFAKLCSIGRKDVIQDYNKWFTNWKGQQDAVLKDVSQWYQNECENRWKIREKRQEEVSDDWEQRKIQLLIRKKELIKLKKELLQLQK